jgi:hypothetical protein
MVFTRFSIFLLLFCFHYMDSALANNNTLFQNYLAQEESYIDRVNHEAKNVFNSSFPECDAEINLQRRKPITLTNIKMKSKAAAKDLKRRNLRRGENIEFDDDIIIVHPEYGQWIERLWAEACDKRININLLVNGYDFENYPVIYPMMNGTSKIAIINQDKAFEAVKASIRQVVKNCSGSVFVRDTFFLGYRDVETRQIMEEDSGNGWFEKWSIFTCNKNYEADIVILPDAKTEYKYLVRMRE